MRVEDRPLVAREGGSAETNRHALGEELRVVGSRHEVPPAATHDAEPRRDRREDVLQRAPTRPPELVGVRVDDPVGAELGRREASHARDPSRLAHVVAGLANEVETTRALVPLEDLRRPVVRAVVGRDHEVDPGAQVERELRIDDVRFVPREERHDEPHRDLDDGRDCVDDTLGRPSVDVADDRATTRARSARARPGRQRALDAGDHVLEALRRVEGVRRRELAVVLADDVLHGPALAGRCAFVVENADGRAVVDERLEQDRAGVRDDARRVLKDRGEHVEVREARLLDVNARSRRAQLRSAPPTRGRVDAA